MVAAGGGGVVAVRGSGVVAARGGVMGLPSLAVGVCGRWGWVLAIRGLSSLAVGVGCNLSLVLAVGGPPSLIVVVHCGCVGAYGCSGAGSSGMGVGAAVRSRTVIIFVAVSSSLCPPISVLCSVVGCPMVFAVLYVLSSISCLGLGADLGGLVWGLSFLIILVWPCVWMVILSVSYL